MCGVLARICTCSKLMRGSTPFAGTIAFLPGSVVVTAMSAPAAAALTSHASSVSSELSLATPPP